MFTAGPWERQEYDKDVGGVPIIAANLGGLIGAALAWPTEIDTDGSDRVTANASLIVAAPAMYAALDDLIEAVMSSDVGFEDYVLQSLFRARRVMTGANPAYKNPMPSTSTHL